jgi:hypothetical protein
MSYASNAIVWVYLVGATLAEMLVFYAFPGNSLFQGVIGVIASSNGILTMVVSMKLKDEPRALQYFMIVPLILLAILLLAIIFDYPTGAS